MKTLTKDELGLDLANYDVVNTWLARGDGIAVYENLEWESPQWGHRQFISYGSAAAQLEAPLPPHQLPDIGGRNNQRYQLIGIYKGELL